MNTKNGKYQYFVWLLLQTAADLEKIAELTGFSPNYLIAILMETIINDPKLRDWAISVIMKHPDQEYVLQKSREYRNLEKVEKSGVSKWMSCEYCKHYFFKDELSRHKSNCTLNPKRKPLNSNKDLR